MSRFDYQQATCVDLGQLAAGSQLEDFDVVIVGTGAGGGIGGEILARSGLRVCLVEEGPLRTAADFDMREKTAYATLYQELAARQTRDKAIQIMQGRAVGGSTTVNWTSCFRTPKQTLDYWQQQFSISEHSHMSMQPWFEWVEKRLAIQPWPLSPNPNNQLLADAAQKLGWQYAVIPRNVKGCANLGYCGMGCPLNAKQSMLVTTIPTALSQGATLLYRARAEQLVIEGEQVRGLWLRAMDQVGQPTGRKFLLKASQFVLSAGAIGSPAILLRSKLQERLPAIGQRTFLHPVTISLAKMNHRVAGYSGAPQSIYSDHFLWQHGVSGVPGFKLEVPPLHPVIAATLLKRHGQQHFDLASDLANYQATIALIRDGFHEQSPGGRVRLDDDGYPQLDYPITAPLWQAFREALLTMAEAQFAMGAQWVMPFHLDASPYLNWSQAQKAIGQLPAKIIRWQIVSAHVMGGAAMNGLPGQGVCDSLGRVKSMKNLRVIDGSLFPTSLGVNPQQTIYSLAAKLSSQLAIDLQARLPQDLADRLSWQGLTQRR